MQKFYVEKKSFVEYMKYIQARLTDEMKRTKMLHPSTETPLMQLCYKILIEKHLDIFDAEFKVWIFLCVDFKCVIQSLMKTIRSTFCDRFFWPLNDWMKWSWCVG